ncbi:MAG: serine/threonine-protein kinase [Planctomycetota bacterium]
MPTSDPIPHVADLVFEYLERADAGHEPPSEALEALCCAWPTRAAALREAVGRLAGAGFVGSVTDEPAGDGDGAAIQLGPFRLDRRLGSGGMGVVYLAERPGEPGPVALKLLRGDLRAEPDANSRFEREMEVAARLDHPNIVRVVDRGTLPSGQGYLAMEYHAGGTADRVVSAWKDAPHRPEGGVDLLASIGAEADPLTLPRGLQGPWWHVVLRLVREVARALAHAHARGVVHRDVKPSNVLITTKGRVLLLDFGLASLRGSGRLTATGVRLGSLPYMSPEQVRGEVDLDEKADVYSLAVTAFELLTLGLPYRGDTPEQLSIAIERGRTVRPSSAVPGLSTDVAQALDAVIGCAMDVDRRRRYASAEAFAADLTALLAGRPVTARPATTLVRTARWVRRRPFVAATVALAGLLVVGGPLAYGVLAQQHADEMEETLDATSAHLATLVRAVDGGIRGLADGPMRNNPYMLAERIRATEGAIEILDDVERDAAEFFARDDERSRSAYAELRSSRARLWFAHGDALMDSGRFDEALASYAKHEASFRAALEANPADQGALHALGAILGQTSRALRRASGGTDPGLEPIEEAIGFFERALELQPADAESASNLAQSLILSLGPLQQSGRGDERIERVHRAIEIVDPIASSSSANAIDRLRLAEALLSSVELDPPGASPSERLSRLDRARAEIDTVLRSDPGMVLARHLSSEVELRSANALEDLGRSEDALARATAGRLTCEALVADMPDEPAFRSRLDNLVDLEIILLGRTGDLVRGLDALREKLDEARDAFDASPEDPHLGLEVGRRIANLLTRLKYVEPFTDEAIDEYEELAAEALYLFEEYGHAVRSATVASFKRYVVRSRGIARAWYGDVIGARHSAEELEVLGDVNSGLHWLELAELHAQILGALVEGGAEEIEQVAWRRRALDALERAVRSATLDPDFVRASDGLEPLKGNERFEALMAEL